MCRHERDERSIIQWVMRKRTVTSEELKTQFGVVRIVVVSARIIRKQLK